MQDRATFSDNIDNRVSIGCNKEIYNIAVYYDKKQEYYYLREYNAETNSMEEVKKARYTYLYNTFSFNKGLFDIEDIKENPLNYVVYEGNIEKTKEFLKEDIQMALDNYARLNNYDSILELISYADEDTAEQQELAINARKWRTDCWNYFNELWDDSIENLLPLPTRAELFAGMPSIL